MACDKITTISYTGLKTLISQNKLCPGTWYKILGFNKNMPTGSPENPDGLLPNVLYDDGTNSGVTIYMMALTRNTMATEGYGEFYNPKYYTDSTDYDTPGLTSLYGIWDGDNPISGLVPIYPINSVVFWGGYAWQNLTGAVGLNTNDFELSTDWLKIPYLDDNGDVSIWYNRVIDEIRVDWNYGIIIERYNSKHDVKVSFTADLYKNIQYNVFNAGFVTCVYPWSSSSLGCVNPISAMGWGIYSKLNATSNDNFIGLGIQKVSVNSGFASTINFKGRIFANNTFNYSFYFDNYIGAKSQVYNLTLNNSAIYYNKLYSQSSVNVSTLIFPQMHDLTVNSSFVISNFLIDAAIHNNTLDDFSNISGSTLGKNSAIRYNHIYSQSSIFSILHDNSDSNTNCIIEYNTVGSNSTIAVLTGDYEFSFSVSYNVVLNKSEIFEIETNQGKSIINYNVVTNNSLMERMDLNNIATTSVEITNNVIQNNSIVRFVNLQDANFKFNNLNASRLISTGTLTGVAQNLGLLTMQNVLWNGLLTSATDIFAFGSEKKAFTRQDGTIRLQYFNTTDTPTIVNFNA